MPSNAIPVSVYPRACGGTLSLWSWCSSLRGLSPRVRGNLAGFQWERIRPGSIPARAGEPERRARTSTVSRVYPRACGGTPVPCRSDTNSTGLSPRVRGNRRRAGLATAAMGSIPARAGEPLGNGAMGGVSRVYPRACGGTGGSTRPADWQAGLSPRVRGNQSTVAVKIPLPGSIPARAGEPKAWAEWCQRRTVYPRACGGTVNGILYAGERYGLSPRVRGNPTAYFRSSKRRGSIPARAGEPSLRWCRAMSTRVYPRACGGTPN